MRVMQREGQVLHYDILSLPQPHVHGHSTPGSHPKTAKGLQAKLGSAVGAMFEEGGERHGRSGKVGALMQDLTPVPRHEIGRTTLALLTTAG